VSERSAECVAIPSTYWKELIAAIEAVLDGFHERDGSVPRNLIEDLDNAYFVAFVEAADAQ